MYCINCGNLIPTERLKAIPGTQTCVNCSTTQAYIGVQVFPHKTGSECQIINTNTVNSGEVLRQAKRANKRSR